MNSAGRGPDGNSQEDLLAGLGYDFNHPENYASPISPDHPQYWPIPARPQATDDGSILQQQQWPISARYWQTQHFANGVDQRFIIANASYPTNDGLHRPPVVHITPFLGRSVDYGQGGAGHYSPAQEYPSDAGGLTNGNETTFGSNASPGTTASNNCTGRGHESLNSQLNAEAAPFIPVIRLSGPDQDNSFGASDGSVISPHQNTTALPEDVCSQTPSLHYEAPRRSYNTSPFLGPYTQTLDNTELSRLGSFGPQSFSAPSEGQNTSSSGWYSHSGLPTIPSATSPSIQRTPSTRSRVTDFGRYAPAPSLARSISCQTDISCDLNVRTKRPASRTLRGRRHGQMDPVKNREAQNVRFSKTVCTFCQLRRVACKKPEDSESCTQCNKKNVTCENHSFFHKLKDSPEHHFGLFLINSATNPSIGSLLGSTVDLKNNLELVTRFTQAYNVRVRCEGEYYDLDLAACERHWNQAKSSFGDSAVVALEDFVTDKQRWQKTSWEGVLCRPAQPERKGHLEDFLQLDKISARATYYLVPRFGGQGMERFLNLEDDADRGLYFFSVLTLERIRHHMELGAYSGLQDELSAKDNKSIRVINLLGQVLVSLRRRICMCKTAQIWKRSGQGPLAHHLGLFGQERIEPPAVRRVEEFCWQLYIHFCFRVAAAKPRTKPLLRTRQLIRHPWNGTQIIEYYPTEENGSRDGFNEWMREGNTLCTQAGMLTGASFS